MTGQRRNKERALRALSLFFYLPLFETRKHEKKKRYTEKKFTCNKNLPGKEAGKNLLKKWLKLR